MSVLVFFVAGAGAGAVSESASARHVLGVRNAPPSGWTLHKRGDSNAVLTFFIALKQRNLDVLESTFWAVSNPKSADYRNFLSIEEINAIIAPQPQLVSTVQQWLLDNGVAESEMSAYVDAFEVSTSVSVAERLFQTEIYAFSHSVSQRIVLRQSGAFSVPAQIRPLIDMVMGISNFPHQRSKRITKTFASENDVGYYFAPQSIYGLYNIPPQKLQNASSITSQGIVVFYGGSYAPSDLQEYGEKINVPIVPLTPDHIFGNVYTEPNYQTTGEIELIATVNTEAMNWFWGETDDVYLYGWTTHFYNSTDVPQVVSITDYYWEGNQCSVEILGHDECEAMGVDSDQYVARVNVDLQKIGLRGVSIIVSAGDYGAHTYSDRNCLAPKLRVEFPASSPYVTSVEGSEIINPTPLANPPELCQSLASYSFCVGTGTEVAPTAPGSGYLNGGGFSQIMPMPDYQSAAVQAYLASGVNLPPSSMYNTSNRAHPDVSALGGLALLYEYPSEWMGIIGTEMATPVFAAIAALLNQASVAKSGKPLGFLNPLLYQIAADNPAAFTDITVGDNLCTSLEGNCTDKCYGYSAAKGWDPVTGLGTPNYSTLFQEVLKLGGNVEAPHRAESS